MGTGSEAVDLEEILQSISEESAPDKGDAGDAIQTADELQKAKIIALEECLHTIAGYALELEAGKREDITAGDIRTAFAAHEVEEIYEEAKIFFDAGAEESDLEEDAGPGEEGEDEDFEGDELAAEEG